MINNAPAEPRPQGLVPEKLAIKDFFFFLFCKNLFGFIKEVASTRSRGRPLFQGGGWLRRAPVGSNKPEEEQGGRGQTRQCRLIQKEGVHSPISANCPWSRRPVSGRGGRRCGRMEPESFQPFSWSPLLSNFHHPPVTEVLPPPPCPSPGPGFCVFSASCALLCFAGDYFPSSLASFLSNCT